MDWFRGTFTGHPYISYENRCPADFPLHQSIGSIMLQEMNAMSPSASNDIKSEARVISTL